VGGESSRGRRVLFAGQAIAQALAAVMAERGIGTQVGQGLFLTLEELTQLMDLGGVVDAPRADLAM